MIIIIDGYNFLKSITGTKFITEQQMHSWMETFEEYRKKRANKILMVFDAGPSYFPSCENIGSIEVCYAGQYQTADDWIKSWLEKNRQKDLLLVSSDREIRSWAQQMGVISLSSQDFYKLFKEALQESLYVQKIADLTLYKTKEESFDDEDQSLDELMHAASLNLGLAGNKYDKDQDEVVVKTNKKISKSDKSLLKKIDKI